MRFLQHLRKAQKPAQKYVWKKWGKLDLNQRPAGYESAALTTELLPQRIKQTKHIKKKKNNQVFLTLY